MTTPEPNLAHSLRTLKNTVLIHQTETLVAHERRISIELLWHLREIERRRIPEEQGLSGIFEYCVKVLKYADGSAYRRVQAMRALHAIPELEASLKNGSLNVTTAATVQSFLQKAKRTNTAIPGIGTPNLPARAGAPARIQTPEEKEKIAQFFKAFEGLSARNVEQKLAELSPTLAVTERERALPTGDLEIKLTISVGTRARWERIREIAAHRMGFDRSARKVVELATEVALDSLEKAKGLGATARTEKEPEESPRAPHSPHLSSNPTARAIPAAVRRFVWKRDEGRCTYRSEVRCESRYGLEIDHIIPWSHGGSSETPSNLRLLCHAHHRHVTAKLFSAPIPKKETGPTPSPE